MKSYVEKAFLIAISISCNVLFSNAQVSIEKGTNFLNFNLGPAIISEGAGRESVNGIMTGLTYERMISEDFSLGVNFSYVSAEGDLSEDGKNKYRSYPTHLTVKGLFGENNFKFYVALGLGAHFSNVKNDKDNVDEQFNGFSVATPVGVYWFPGGGSFFFNGNYTLSALTNSPYEANFTHVFNFGIGFVWPQNRKQ